MAGSALQTARQQNPSGQRERMLHKRRRKSQSLLSPATCEFLFILCCIMNERQLSLPPRNNLDRALAAIFVLRARAAKKPKVQTGLIVLKNSSLIGCLFADSIALLIGGFSDDGTEAGSTCGAVL